MLHRSETPVGHLGPWEPTQRYWRGNDPEFDIIARSNDGNRVLVGEAQWRAAGRTTRAPDSDSMRGSVDTISSIKNLQPIPVMFLPENPLPSGENAFSAENAFSVEKGFHCVNARTVIEVLR